MEITLDIQDNRFNTFLDFIKTLDYVSVRKESISQWQQDEVNRRLALVDSGKMETRDWEDIKDGIFEK
ncbi:MAG: addiction module protein [Cyclobacteriaceae bacterium]|nr:addiction module protein [Cyclobacteriaceae bacterium]